MDYTPEEEAEYEKLRREAMLEQYGVESIELVQEDTTPAWATRWQWEKASALSEIVFPAQQWLVDGLLSTEGVALLAAESGTYKTWLGLQLAVCCCLGQTWLKFPVMQGKVLYINGEIPRREAQRRIRRLGVTGAFSDDFHFIHTPLQLDGYDDYYDLLELVQREKYDLIVGDTLSKLHSGRASENDNDAMTDLMIKARKISEASGGLFLMLHHVSKPPGFPLSLLHRIRGASAIRDNAGSAVLLQKQDKGKGAYVNLTNPKNWFGAELEPIKTWLIDEDEKSYFQWSEGDTDDTAEDVAADEIGEALHNLYDLHGDEIPVSALRANLSTASQIVMTKIINDMADSGIIIIYRSKLRKLIKPGPEW